MNVPWMGKTPSFPLSYPRFSERKLTPAALSLGVYAASKRSLEIISETLRLELKPFRVRVLAVVTGAVQSNGQTYFEDLELPEGSLYKGLKGG